MDEHDIVGYYPEFRLPSWFEETSDVRQLLRTLWDRRYKGVDEEEDGPTPWSVQEAYATLINVLWGMGDVVGYQRCIFLGWGLALACAPTIARWAPMDPMPQRVLDAVPPRLRKPVGVLSRNWSPLFPHLQVGTQYQELDEARLAFRAFTQLLDDRNQARPALVEMLGHCMEGMAINEGGDGRRDLWNWVLIEVTPAAWSLRLPDFIWTWPQPPHPAAERRPKAFS